VAQVAQFNNNKAFRLFFNGTNLAQVAQTNFKNAIRANKMPTKRPAKPLWIKESANNATYAMLFLK